MAPPPVPRLWTSRVTPVPPWPPAVVTTTRIGIFILLRKPPAKYADFTDPPTSITSLPGPFSTVRPPWAWSAASMAARTRSSGAVL
ncbi:MAG: hypothetical protein ACRDI0_00665 [Actinomycetota bacterium]